MEALNALYAQLLQFGLVRLRDILRAGRYDWAEVEAELLHNIPSLLGEANPSRHDYFWNTEREAYIDWVNAPGREDARSHMLTYYMPIWREMEPLMAQMLAKGSPRTVATK